jgi:hypothetical protein
MSDEAPNYHFTTVPELLEEIEKLLPRVRDMVHDWAQKEGIPQNALLGGALAYLGLWAISASILNEEPRSIVIATLLTAAESGGRKIRTLDGIPVFPKSGSDAPN